MERLWRRALSFHTVTDWLTVVGIRGPVSFIQSRLTGSCAGGASCLFGWLFPPRWQKPNGASGPHLRPEGRGGVSHDRRRNPLLAILVLP